MSDAPAPHDALADAYQELARRRASGEITPEIEAEIDRAFALVAPASAVGGDGRLLIDMAAERSSIHPHAPVDSRSPVGVLSKRLVRKASFWYISWLAEAVADFAGTITQALRLVEARVRRLEGLVVPGASTAGALAATAALPPDAATLAVVGERLAASVGAVVVTDDATGVLVAALAEGPGCPRTVLTELPGRASGLVAAVVLVGVVDRAPAAVLVDLAQQAAAALAPRGRLVVVTADPSAALTEAELVARELGGGRPLSPPTWRHILAGVGLVSVEVESVNGRFVITAVRPA